MGFMPEDEDESERCMREGPRGGMRERLIELIMGEWAERGPICCWKRDCTGKCEERGGIIGDMREGYELWEGYEPWDESEPLDDEYELREGYESREG